MIIVVGGWNQVPRAVGSLKIIELHWQLHARWRRTRAQNGDLRALDTDTPQQVNK
jgi:hypothetical protein